MSNLIALKDANNDIGLGTSYISLGTNSGTSILPFKKNDGTILMNFNTTNNSIHLGTINSGIWCGNAIGTSYGGTGLTTIGSAGQVLSVKSNPNEGLEWTTISSSGGNAKSVTSIATSASSAIGIGSRNQNLTINASLLNINIGNTTLSNNQVLEYNGSSLQWQTNPTTGLNKLFSLINTFHPGYILLLKSLDVKVSSVSQTLVPSFDIGTTNYSVGIGSNYTVSILPTLFSSTTDTKINNSIINIPNTSTYGIGTYTSHSTFSIKNNYNNSSRTYILNITRTILHNADLKDITITTNPTITFNSFSSSTTSYNIDVLSNLTSFIMTTQVHNTSSYIFISTTQNNHNQTSLNINSTTGNVDATSNLESSITNKTITPIYVFIKAENANITKEYIFNISRPPRYIVDITSIEILNSSSNLIGSAITSFTSISTITTANADEHIKFRITKNHTHQTVNIKLGSNSLETLSATNEIVTSGNIANVSQSNVTSGGSNGASQTYSLVITGADSTSTNTIDVTIKRPSSDDGSLSFIGVDSSTTNRISEFSGSNNSFTNSTTINSIDNSVVIHFTAATDVYGQSVKVGLGNNYTSASDIELNNNSNNITVNGLSEGDNTINIQVTSQSNNIVRLYTFTKIHVLQLGNLLESIQTREVSTDPWQTVNNFTSSGGTFTLQHESINDTLDIVCTLQTTSNLATVSFAINNPLSISPVPSHNAINTITHSQRFSGLSGSTKLIEKTTYTITITVTSQIGTNKQYTLTVVQKNTISTLTSLNLTSSTSNSYSDTINTSSISPSLTFNTAENSIYVTPIADSTPVTIKYSIDNNYESESDTSMTSGVQSTLSLNTGNNEIYIYVIAEAGTLPPNGDTIPNGDIDIGGQSISYISIYYRNIYRYNDLGSFSVSFPNGQTTTSNTITVTVNPSSGHTPLYVYITISSSSSEPSFSSVSFYDTISSSTNFNVSHSALNNAGTYYLHLFSQSHAKYIYTSNYSSYIGGYSYYVTKINPIVPIFGSAINQLGSSSNYNSSSEMTNYFPIRIHATDAITHGPGYSYNNRYLRTHKTHGYNNYPAGVLNTMGGSYGTAMLAAGSTDPNDLWTHSNNNKITTTMIRVNGSENEFYVKVYNEDDGINSAAWDYSDGPPWNGHPYSSDYVLLPFTINWYGIDAERTYYTNVDSRLQKIKLIWVKNDGGKDWFNILFGEAGRGSTPASSGDYRYLLYFMETGFGTIGVDPFRPILITSVANLTTFENNGYDSRLYLFAFEKFPAFTSNPYGNLHSNSTEAANQTDIVNGSMLSK